MVRTHEPGQAVFTSILPEQVDWQPFPARLPRRGSLAEQQSGCLLLFIGREADEAKCSSFARRFPDVEAPSISRGPRLRNGDRIGLKFNAGELRGSPVFRG
jgi:hypothetical protein